MKIIMGVVQATFGIIWVGIIGLFTTIGIAHIVTEDIVDKLKNIKNKKRGNKNE